MFKLDGVKVIWNKNDKMKVKEYIYNLYQKMEYPEGCEGKLTRINWSKAIVREAELFISINITFEGKYHIDHDRWRQEYRVSRFYHTTKISLKIPISEFRDKKLKELLGE